MISHIFTDEERRILESYITNAKVDQKALSKLFEQIKNEEGLFADIFLYLQVRKAIPS